MDRDNRKMFQGDWSCSGCGSSITELPFEPRSTDNLLCRDCHSKQRNNSRGERRMFKGDWKCSSCDTDINELPFEPKDTGNLMCRDCFRKSKGLS
jgi:CxxC-x17-CxxC domain-containing protein